MLSFLNAKAGECICVYMCVYASEAIDNYIHLLYKAKKILACPSAVFWLSISLPLVQGSTSNLIKTKHPSSEMIKFISKFLTATKQAQTCYKDNPF